jgi:hypothetical protein
MNDWDRAVSIIEPILGDIPFDALCGNRLSEFDRGILAKGSLDASSFRARCSWNGSA